MHVEYAIAACSELGVVRNESKGRSALAMAAKQKLNDLASRCLVKISGRLVGHEDGGIGRERAGQRDALLLAAGKFGWIMMEPRGKSDGFQFVLRSRQRIALSGEF